MRIFESLWMAGFLLVLLSSCASGKLFINQEKKFPELTPTTSPDYTIYAVGDAGELNDKSRLVMRELSAMATDDIQPGIVLFLGDNIYPAGMPPESNIKAHLDAQDVLMNQVFGLKSFDGQLIFIPGNHDWNEFKAGGLDAIKRQGDFLKKLNEDHIGMQPENGCGGPVVTQLTNEIVLIIIDSQWWLQDWEKEPMMNDGCNIQFREDLITSLHQTIDANKGKQIVITMHHPLYSQGAHGGHFTVRDHLFPLSKVVDWLYLPLPVLGSIYPLYRSIIGHPQDITHRNYTELKNAILQEVDDDSDIIFLAGHDHNLQYIEKGNHHFILSGSGSKINPVANARELIYGHKAHGFVQLDFYKNVGVQLMVYELEPESGKFRTVFSRFIIEYEDD